eukprot:CAMPEP_0169470804 /NCGR_PEP_ID=MMETSP1042-20121227/24249_1 /TAXON_ID=464988 /ORGANISM="Hemiselmis andersenii, Strain CCMP1180" /LENGTH=79 /DNA_ID=CAMNT_0009584453 /DNA_START=104 /DNA_END=340 /DNA_ORIENTATION=-
MGGGTIDGRRTLDLEDGDGSAPCFMRQAIASVAFLYTAGSSFCEVLETLLPMLPRETDRRVLADRFAIKLEEPPNALGW